MVAGVYAGFMWSCINPSVGTHFPEDVDTDFLLDIVKLLFNIFIRVHHYWVDLFHFMWI